MADAASGSADRSVQVKLVLLGEGFTLQLAQWHVFAWAITSSVHYPRGIHETHIAYL